MLKILSLIIFFYFINIASCFANEEIYNIKNNEVYLENNGNVLEVRENAKNISFRNGFNILAKNILTPEDFLKFTQISDFNPTELVSDYKIESEKITEINYYAEISINFNPERVRKFFSENSINLNMGNSGTCTRLVTAQLASSAITSRLFADKSLSKRPLRIINVLNELGCNIQAYRKKFLPIKIYGNPDTIQSNISIKKSSAQIISSAIFCAMNSYGTSNIISKNDSRDHTEKLLKYLKYPINIKLKKTNKIKNISIIGKQKLEAINNYRIPSDPSSAAFLIVLSTLSENSNLTIRNVLINKFRIQ